MEKKIDGYIEKIDDDYNMYFHYNGVEFCFLYKDWNAKSFAIHFAQKVNKDLPGVSFTDDHGYTEYARKVSFSHDQCQIISAIKGADNIREDLVHFMVACKNLDINSDFAVHFDGNSYDLVSDKKDSIDNLVQLENALLTITKDKNGSQGKHI